MVVNHQYSGSPKPQPEKGWFKAAVLRMWPQASGIAWKLFCRFWAAPQTCGVRFWAAESELWRPVESDPRSVESELGGLGPSHPGGIASRLGEGKGGMRRVIGW